MRTKKVMRTIALAVALVFMFSTAAMAAIPEFTIIFGDKAYNQQLLDDESMVSEILGAFKANDNTYAYKDGAGDITDPYEKPIDPSTLPEVTYKDAEGNEKTFAAGDGDEIIDSTELAVVSVSAINATQAEVVFNKAVKEVTPANFKVTDKDGNLVFVSKVELNKAKDVATLTFFDKFADKATYTVEVSNVADVDGNVMEKATEAFTYVVAEVAKVEFTQTTVGHNTDLRKVVKVTDKLGRDVTSEYNIEFESSNIIVVPEDGKVLTPEDGSSIVVAKVKVGDSYVKSAPTTINVKKAAPATFVGSYVYTGDAAVDTEKFAELKDEDKINHVYMDEEGKHLALYYNDQYGNKLGAVTTFNGTEEDGTKQPVLENLTPTVVIVANDGTITPVSAGDGYVKVTNGDVVTTVKIVVREESAIQSMEVEKTDVSVVEGISDTVKITFKDQFGTKKDAAPTAAKSSASAIATAQKVENGVLITGVKEGTATVEVTYKNEANKVDLTETINVTVTKAADLATYQVVVKDTKLDISGDDNNADKLPKSTNVVVNEIDANGNKIGTAINVTLKEVDKDGKDLEAGKELLDTTKLSNKVVEAKTNGTPGIAYVQVEVGTLVVDTLEFEVVNTKSTPTSVSFTRNDLVLSATDAIGLDSIDGAQAQNGDKATGLNSIVKVLDQNGKVMAPQDLTFTYSVTNIDGLILDASGKKVDSVLKATSTADVIITKIVAETDDNTNLISSPVQVKLVVNATNDELGAVTNLENLGQDWKDTNEVLATNDITVTQTGNTIKLTGKVVKGKATEYWPDNEEEHTGFFAALAFAKPSTLTNETNQNVKIKVLKPEGATWLTDTVTDNTVELLQKLDLSKGATRTIAIDWTNAGSDAESEAAAVFYTIDFSGLEFIQEAPTEPAE